MKKSKKLIISTLAILIMFCFSLSASAVTWEFNKYGEGINPFTPRGYVIETENGHFWLSSLFDNSTEDTLYTGHKNGVSYIEARRSDDKLYKLYAYTDRNPRIYKYLAAYKNGERIADFTDYIQAPGRLEVREIMGSGAIWGIPVEGFEFKSGCYYEFCFLRGMQANNGITLVFSEDESGYIQNPSTEEEKAKYEADKNKEFEYLKYWIRDDGSFGMQLLPMRFSVQTYADTSMWTEGRKPAEDFLNSVKPEDYESGKYYESNIENLRTVLAELDEEILNDKRMMLQDAANMNMDLMLGELEIALKRAMSPRPEGADLRELKAVLKEARMVYRQGSKNIGDGLGQYNQEAIDALALQISFAEAITSANTQEEVNTAVDNLREAVTRVYASVIREESLIFYDEASGIKMIVPMASVTAETKLFVKRFDKEAPEFTEATEKFGLPEDRITLYDIRLLDSENEILPTKNYSMQIPVTPAQRKANVYFMPQPAEEEIGEDTAEPEDKQLTEEEKKALEPQVLRTAYADGFKLFKDKRTGRFAVIMPEDAPIEEIPPEPEEPETEEPEKEDKQQLVDITDDEIKDNPDNTEQEVRPTEGEVYVPEKIEEEDEKLSHGPQYPVIIPLAQMSREAEALPILLVLTVILLLVLLIIFTALWRGRKKQRR